LARRNTKIKERAVYGANAKLVKDTGCVPEIRLPDDDAAAKTRESLAVPSTIMEPGFGLSNLSTSLCKTGR